MIAANNEGPIEAFVKLITAPVWVPVYLAYLCFLRAAEALLNGKDKARRVNPNLTRAPDTEIERAVYAALILAGEPVTNRRLAELMGCSPGEVSKRVAQLEGAIRKARNGREVLISLH